MSDPEQAATIVPAANLDAEEHVLGAILLVGSQGVEASRRILEAVQATGLTPDAFYREHTHGRIYDAALALAARGEPADCLTVAAELERRGELEAAGGRGRIGELAALAPDTANIEYHARLILAAARTRALARVLGPVVDAARNGGVDPAAAQEALEEARKTLGKATSTPRSRIDAGGSFVLDAPEMVPAVWGRAGLVLWAAGEALMLVGPEGVSKSTLAQRLALARIGLASSALGLPVAAGERRTLYLALDRPRQIARSFRRMLAEEQRATLDDRLTVYAGALLLDVLKEPTALAELAHAHGADTLIIDSLKDLAPGLAADETGAVVSIALQHVLSAGVELLAVHHQRKAQADNKKPTTLADVYGSRWLTAGAGSVVLLWGEPGDVLLELRHLKQPAEEIGPWTLTVDHTAGALAVHEATDLAALLAMNPAGLTAPDAARRRYATEKPNRSQVEKARRELEALVGEGIARRIEPGSVTDAVRYVERIEVEARA